jgi:hypothetical protein
MHRIFRCLPRSNWVPWALLIALAPLATWAADPECGVVSGQRLTPVIELYTSEGCSSCLHRSGDADRFEALVRPTASATTWTAYWRVTEHGHSSRVNAGENAGEFLKHDFVVRQYTPVGQYQGEKTLEFFAIPAQPAHPRHINLVVSDLQTGEPLQAVSLTCS